MQRLTRGRAVGNGSAHMPNMHDEDESDPNCLIPDGRLGKERFKEYFNGDVYDGPPFRYEQDWEIDTFVPSSNYTRAERTDG